ncbi:MAG: prepilin-type N-terminal cleavage/methylation domain-containing protein, partial [Atribacterales bacterium]
MSKRKHGFTLIELIVVVAILGIIVTLAVPRFLGQTQEANLTKLKHDAHVIQDASDRYYLDHGNWPFLLDEEGNAIIVTEPESLKIIYKVQEYEEDLLGTDPATDIVLYEIDFDKLRPYIRKLDSNVAYFVAAHGNPDFAISVLDPTDKETQKRLANQDDPHLQKPVAIITMTPNQGLTTKTLIQWSYESSYDPNGLEIIKAEWEGRQDKYETEGEYTVRLRVQNSAGIWSDWIEKTFYVFDANDVVQIVAGHYHSLALTQDGSV